MGQQWLTLYAVRMEGKDPILAATLKAVVDSNDIPAGYSTGIHMFGEDTSYNLNNNSFVWDQDAETIHVYYKVDQSTASESGSVFSVGMLALVGGACFLLGAVLAAVCLIVVRKRKEIKTAAM